MLEELVPENVLRKIEQITLRIHSREDEVVRCRAKDGQYVVKKRYYCAKEKRSIARRRNGCLTDISSDMWRKVWKIKALPKVLHFLWRCLVSAVPVKDSLVKRKCSTTALCPVCAEEPETLEHMLFFCAWARCV